MDIKKKSFKGKGCFNIVEPGDFISLDPIKVSDSISFNVMNQIFEGLMIEKTDNYGNTKIIEGNAEKIDVSIDKKTYIFHLRNNAKWTDGQPVRAQDYVFAWKRLINPLNNSPYMFLLKDLNISGANEILNLVNCTNNKLEVDKIINKLGIEAKDDKTFVVKLTKITPFFLNAMASKVLIPVREDIVKTIGNDRYGSDYTKVVSNGPFTLVNYKKNVMYTYKKNCLYWNEKVIKIETINCPIITETNTMVNMFEKGNLDACGGSNSNLEKLIKQSQNNKIKYIRGVDSKVFYLILNTEKGILKNSKIRKALSLALDRKKYLDATYRRLIPAYGLIPDGIDCNGEVYRKQVPEPIKTNIIKAKSLMNEGLKEEHISASKVKIRYLLGTKTTTSSKMGDYIEKLYRDIFDIKVIQEFTKDEQSCYSRIDKGDFEMADDGWSPDYNDVSSFFNVFLSYNKNNSGRYNNAHYDELVNKASNEQNVQIRLNLYKEAEKILIRDDAAIIPTKYSDLISFTKNYVNGSYCSKFSGTADYSQIYIKHQSD